MTLVRGRPVDDQTRCAHWSGPLDVVAFRFACCHGWWPCHDCHVEAAGHRAKPWPATRADEHAVRCGACGATMTPRDYAASGSRCPNCAQGFNPGCRPHWPLYFES